MHQLVPVFAALALYSFLDGGLAAKLPRQSLINTMDNEISINAISPVTGRRNFIDIEEPPTPATHTVGGTTQLYCEAIGSPTPHIEWLKNGMPIREEISENNEILDVSQNSMARVRSTLVINTASPNKEDLYTCIAQAGVKIAEASAKVFNEDPASETENFTDLMSLNRHLLAAPMKPVITEYLKVLMDDTNVNIVLPCRARGNPTPDIYWHSEDNHLILNRDPRVRVLESGELLITGIRWSDMGGYTCTAKNAFGKESVTTFLYPVIGEKKKMKF